MSGQRPRVNIVTVVWGEWHVNAFCLINLPTLLAPGNLPSLAAECEVTFDIYSKESDFEKIILDRSYQMLERQTTVRVHKIPKNLVGHDPVPDPIHVHREMWSDAIERAKRERAMVLLMSPDVAWSDGSLRHVRNLLIQGRKVLFNFYLRVVSDTFIHDFFERYRATGGAIVVSSRDLVALSMRHIHPIMAAYSRFWENYPDHAELMIWPVRGEGLVVRNFARECLLFDPHDYPLNDRNLIDVAPRPNEAEFITDSDNFFAVSLTPLGKELHRWLAVPKKIDSSWLGRWWLEYDSPMNDLTAAAKVRIHHVEPTKRLWQQVELESDLLVRRAAMFREAFRSWRALHDLKCNRAAEILALAMYNGAIRHLTAASGRLVIFAPSDDGLSLIPEDQLARRLGMPDAEGINGLIRAHVVIQSESQPDLVERVERERQVELTALDGSKIRIRMEKNSEGSEAVMIVNDLYKISARLQSGYTIVLRLEGLLNPMVGLKWPESHASCPH